MVAVGIRPAVDSDTSTVSKVVAEAIRSGYTQLLGEAATQRLVAEHCSLPRIRAEIGIPGGAPGWLGWLVAELPDGTVAGVAAGGVPAGGSGEVYVLCTAPERQRAGVGGALLTAVTAQQVEQGAHEQYISLPDGDAPARGFLVRRGFRPREPVDGEPGTGALRCRRPL